MKTFQFRLPEFAAATLISTVVLLVAVTPALLAAPNAVKPAWDQTGRTSAAVTATVPAASCGV
jgi:hypothetical protein